MIYGIPFGIVADSCSGIVRYFEGLTKPSPRADGAEENESAMDRDRVRFSPVWQRFGIGRIRLISRKAKREMPNAQRYSSRYPGCTNRVSP